MIRVGTRLGAISAGRSCCPPSALTGVAKSWRWPGATRKRPRTMPARPGSRAPTRSWTELVEDDAIDAVAIATPPALQPDIAIQALQRGKAVFLEKPLAATIAQADALLEQAQQSKRPVMIDFEFPELPAWQRAKALMDEKAIGKLRHVAVTWHVENHATRMRLKSWKTNGDDGGGVLGNFVSHCFHYLEYFGGPLANLYAQVFGLPGEKKPSESIVALIGRIRLGRGVEPFDERRVLSRIGASHGILRRGRHADAGQYRRRLYARLRIILRASAGGDARAHRM